MKKIVQKMALLATIMVVLVLIVAFVSADEKKCVSITAKNFVETKKLKEDDYNAIQSQMRTMLAANDECLVEMYLDGQVVVFDEDTQLEVNWDNSLLDYNEYGEVHTYIGDFKLQRESDGTLTVLSIDSYSSYFYNMVEYGGGGVLTPWTDFVKEYGDETVDEGHKSYEVGKIITDAMSSTDEMYNYGYNAGVSVIITGTTKEGKEFVSYVILIPEGDSVLQFETEEPTEEISSEVESTTENSSSEQVTEPVIDKSEEYKVILDDDKTIVKKAGIADIINENKHKDIVIQSNPNITFTFKKGTMSEVTGVEKYDFGVTVSSEFKTEAEYSAGLKEENFVTHISFNYSGELPGKASIKIYVGADYKGQELYYSQVDGDVFKFIQSSIVDKNGYITVNQEHCSDYVITREKIDLSERENSMNDNGIKSNDSPFGWIFIAVVVVVVVVVVLAVSIILVLISNKRKLNNN